MTHTTKYGFGGLLSADLLCEIISQDGENCVIKLESGIIIHGKLTDLNQINNK